jgi:xylulokinase
VTDRSDASATLLWDVPGERWSAAALAAAELPARLLPEVRPASEVVGTSALLAASGEVPVVVGGADTALALLAAGGTAPQLNLGTGAQLLAPGWVPEPADDPPVHGYADAEAGWYRMAALRNAGSAWSWVCRVLGLDWPALFAAAEAAPPGAGGVVFRPFLTGERGGVAGPADRGSWTGLQAGTTREDLGRAAVEGVVFAVAAAARLAGQGDGELLVTGGGARADVVRRLLADVLGRPVRVLGMRSASAVGAAVLAARGAGADVVPQRHPEPPVEPRADPALAAAAERWAGGGVEPPPRGHR